MCSILPPGGQAVDSAAAVSAGCGAGAAVRGGIRADIPGSGSPRRMSFTQAGFRRCCRRTCGGSARQGFAGLLWSKQFYHYVVRDWLDGDPEQPAPPESRWKGRNRDWLHLFNRDVISMPDKWEYPWYAAWDLAFHMIAFAAIDPEFAKEQLVLMLREWYMHPNGQLPAYEFEFSDVNPPVHAWACWRVYKMTGPRGGRDRMFLERTFQKLLLNFTWWVNRKDVNGRNIFGGGFLGLDNIGVFDRSKPLPTGGRAGSGGRHGVDGVLLLAPCSPWRWNWRARMPVYEDIASKFFEHFVAIVDAMNTLGGNGLVGRAGRVLLRPALSGWPGDSAARALDGGNDSAVRGGSPRRRRDRQMPGFRKRMDWFLNNRKDLARHISYMKQSGGDHLHYLLAIPSQERLVRVLRYLLDE